MSLHFCIDRLLLWRVSVHAAADDLTVVDG
jgi:hypothetical protein